MTPVPGTPAPAAPAAAATRRADAGVGASAPRPDGTLKVTGEFAFSSDMWMADMLWGATLRSPHPRARIRSMDITGALRLPGVAAVLTADDVPGRKTFGLEAADQPVLADGQIRYQGEPLVIIAADHPETAHRAAAAVTVDYEVLTPVTDAETALQPGAEPVHTGGNLVRHVRIRRGDPQPAAGIVVSGRYQVGMQDQAFLGPESGLAVPAEDGGIELYVATQWLHVDQAQIAVSLGMPEDKVRVVLAGVGGAFGAREDLSMQIHACLLALHTGLPVKMVYSREESFFGHVHRHPATLYYEHGITPEGRLVWLRARVYLDGGAYMSSSPAVVANAATLGAGPYEVPNVAIDVYAAYTNNPPCGAMRGFGAVQAAFAYESQMDECARRLGLDPVEFRIRNAMSEGSVMPTGQVVDSAAPVAELLRRVRDAPMPAPRRRGSPDRTCASCPAECPTPRTARASSAASGTASASRTWASPKGSTTTPRPGYGLRWWRASPRSPCIRPPPRWARAWSPSRRRSPAPNWAWTRSSSIPPTPRSAARARPRRPGRPTSPAARCRLLAPPSAPGCSRWPRSGSRYRARTCRWPAARWSLRPPGCSTDLATLLGGEAMETVTWRHRPTHPLDPETGQGNAHVQYAFAAHRAVVDVDTELRLVKVVELTSAQDVGKAMNPLAVRPDPRRHGAGPGPGTHGGDPGGGRNGAQPLVHRLPDPHHPRHAPDEAGHPGTRRPARAVRPARGGRAADDLLDPGDRRRDPGRDRQATAPGAGPPGRDSAGAGPGDHPGGTRPPEPPADLRSP